MKSKIVQKVGEIESDRGIDVISVREMGSRLLGVANSDSDWDIMFIYTFDGSWKYPAIGHSKKSITVSEEELDMHGWNIDKFAKHLQDSNPQTLEFLEAEPYFQEYEEVWGEIEKDARNNFNHMALYSHYMSLAKRQYKKYIQNGNDSTKGRHFYVARALAAASYIRNFGEMPPTDSVELANEIERGWLSAFLREMSKEKRSGNGDDYIGNRFPNGVGLEKNMEPTDERTKSPDPKLINQLLRDAL